MANATMPFFMAKVAGCTEPSPPMIKSDAAAKDPKMRIMFLLPTRSIAKMGISAPMAEEAPFDQGGLERVHDIDLFEENGTVSRSKRLSG